MNPTPHKWLAPQQARSRRRTLYAASRIMGRVGFAIAFASVPGFCLSMLVALDQQGPAGFIAHTLKPISLGFGVMAAAGIALCALADRLRMMAEDLEPIAPDEYETMRVLCLANASYAATVQPWLDSGAELLARDMSASMRLVKKAAA